MTIFKKLALVVPLVFSGYSFNAFAQDAVIFNGVTYNVELRKIDSNLAYSEFYALISTQPWFSKNPVDGTYVQKFNFLSLPEVGPNLDPDINLFIVSSLLPPISGVDPNALNLLTLQHIQNGLGLTGSSYQFMVNNTPFIYIIIPRGPSSFDTYASFLGNSFALLSYFNHQSSKVAQGLTYDCTVYDQKNICVSFLGSKSDGKGFDATTGALIVAHKPTKHFRFGGYIDQSFGSDTSGGLTVKKGNPGFGVFGVWSQNADGSGVQVRAAANMGKVDIETQREVIGTAEAGFGKSNIKSQGFQLEVSKDYAINSQWTARPYMGYRKTTNTRAGYTESDDVTAPLTYSKLKQNTETLTAGATFAHTLSAKTKMFLTAGVEHDLKNSIGRYAAANDDIGDIDSIEMSSNKRKTRPTVSFALNHDIDKTQRVGVSLTHRKEAFASGSTTSAFLQYSKGF